MTKDLRCVQNKLMSKKLAFLTAKISFLLSAASVYAVTDLIQPGSGFVDPGSRTAEQTVSGTASLVVNLLFAVAAILAVIYLLIGGIRWITSRGDKVSVEAARKQIVAAVIGLVVVAAAFLILNVVFGILGVSTNPLSPGGFTLPTLQNPNP